MSSSLDLIHLYSNIFVKFDVSTISSFFRCYCKCRVLAEGAGSVGRVSWEPAPVTATPET